MIIMGLWKKLGLLLVVSALASPAHAEDVQQARYDTPEAAAQALIEAAVVDDSDALKVVLGPEAGELASGDPVADEADREAFVDAAVAAAGIEQEDGVDDRAVLVIGEDDWPFAIPLVRDDQGWSFDTAAGLEEIYARRIGRNELHAIAVLRAYVEAQYEYASADRTGDGVRQFARKFSSGEGKRDGLYWPVAEGEPESPLGPLVADAVATGYGKETGGPSPYHGYYFRILEEQGAGAPGGAVSYVNDDRMTTGFAAIAYPAEYANSGIMTFIVNQQDIVFENDLGEETGTLAAAITAYDPDDSWDPVTED